MRGSTETTVQMSLQFLTAVLVMSVVSCDVIFCVSFAHFWFQGFYFRAEWLSFLGSAFCHPCLVSVMKPFFAISFGVLSSFFSSGFLSPLLIPCQIGYSLLLRTKFRSFNAVTHLFLNEMALLHLCSWKGCSCVIALPFALWWFSVCIYFVFTRSLLGETNAEQEQSDSDEEWTTEPMFDTIGNKHRASSSMSRITQSVQWRTGLWQRCWWSCLFTSVFHHVRTLAVLSTCMGLWLHPRVFHHVRALVAIQMSRGSNITHKYSSRSGLHAAASMNLISWLGFGIAAAASGLLPKARLHSRAALVSIRLRLRGIAFHRRIRGTVFSKRTIADIGARRKCVPIVELSCCWCQARIHALGQWCRSFWSFVFSSWKKRGPGNHALAMIKCSIRAIAHLIFQGICMFKRGKAPCPLQSQ